jgi:GNAT superfamily N-acetyltransferase
MRRQAIIEHMFYTNARSPVKLCCALVTIATHVVTPDRWPDLAELFERKGPRGGSPQTDGCWCQFWRLRGKAYWDGHGMGNRAALEAEIASGAEPGLLAYVDGTAVGWCRIGPREQFERLEHARNLGRVDDEPTWAAVCFYVHAAAKRQGLATALLRAGLARAKAGGAQYVEGYPVRPGHPNIDAYTGYLPMFVAAGFTEVRNAGRRIFVRKRL